MVLRRQILALLILLFLANNVLSAPQDWKCGTTGTEQFTYDVVNFECPMARPGIGLCCAVHDTCYDNQLGREKCDSNFCACMTNSMNLVNCRGATVQNFCSLVKLNGGLAYTLAGIKKNNGR